MRFGVIFFIFFFLTKASHLSAFDINSFANQQKSGFLTNSLDVKTRIAPVVGYKEPNLTNGIDSYRDQNKTAAIMDLMAKTQGGNSWKYSCKDTRVIAEIEKWICSQDSFIYPKQTLCESNCKKQGTCLQSSCNTAFACDNNICPIQKTQCNGTTKYLTPTCTAPAVWNSTSKKCEGMGATTYAATFGYILVGTLPMLGAIPACNQLIDGQWINTGWDFSQAHSGVYTKNSIGAKLVTYDFVTTYCYKQGYTCNPGDTLSGTTCTHSTLVQTDGQCPANYALTNGQCVGTSYSCPSGSGACNLSATDGKYYCSPYPCSTNAQGEQWCSTDPIIGDGRAGYQCPTDGSWAPTQDACQMLCQYFKCQESGKIYQSDTECKQNCNQAKPCTKY